ncbi:hypothetical protein N3C_2160 [Clostridium sp. N3C]|nr:hypothetical protein N3C_2160 [Clostridium sp. N3C]
MKKYLCMNKLLLFITICLIFLDCLMTVGTAYIFKYIIDTATNADMRAFFNAILVTLVFLLLGFVIGYF